MLMQLITDPLVRSHYGVITWKSSNESLQTILILHIQKYMVLLCFVLLLLLSVLSGIISIYAIQSCYVANGDCPRISEVT